jgi:hypothetical protein
MPLENHQLNVRDSCENTKSGLFAGLCDTVTIEAMGVLGRSQVPCRFGTR